jgi:hypothetical protein
MATVATKPRSATGCINHYPVEFDADLPINGSVSIGYRVLRPENWRSHNPHFDSDIEWWIDAINELYIPTSGGRARIETVEHHGELIGMIVAALCDEHVSRACARHYDNQVL